MMKTVGIAKMSPEATSFICYSSKKYVPRLLKNRVINRRHSSFMYIVKGNFDYFYDGGGFHAKSGAVIYLPASASYSYSISDENGLCIQCETDVFSNGERCVVSDVPTVLTQNASFEIRSIFDDMAAHSDGTIHCGFLLTSYIYRLIACLTYCMYGENNAENGRITPAVAYLRSNYAKKVQVSTLAEMCYLSESQLRRLFLAEFGVTPIEYKNKLRIDAACDMFRFGYNNVGEVSDLLGFDSRFNFSQCFRKNVGVSPSAYVEKYGHSRKAKSDVL